MPSLLSSLLLRSHAGLLTLLLIVLPLHSVVQLVAGLQVPRHRHTSAEFADLSAPSLGPWLDRLQAEPVPGWTGAGGWHAMAATFTGMGRWITTTRSTSRTRRMVARLAA